MEKIPIWLRYSLAILLFWVLLIGGPFLLSLWNALSFYRIEPDSLLWYVFRVALQPISAGAAAYAAFYFTPTGKGTMVTINSIVAICLIVFFLSAIVLGIAETDWMLIITYVLTIITLIVAIVKSRSLEIIEKTKAIEAIGRNV